MFNKYNTVAAVLILVCLAVARSVSAEMHHSEGMPLVELEWNLKGYDMWNSNGHVVFVYNVEWPKEPKEWATQLECLADASAHAKDVEAGMMKGERLLSSALRFVGIDSTPIDWYVVPVCIRT